MSEDTKPTKLINETVRTAALDILNAAREMNEWDLPPALVLVGQGDDDKPAYVPVPVPDHLWFNSHPGAVVQALAKGLRAGALGVEIGESTITTGNIVGAILFTEGHDVDSAHMTPAEKATLDDFAARHRLSEHPKARELRMATMVDRNLTRALGRHTRGDEVSDRIIYGFSGRLPDCLVEFMAALMTSWMSKANSGK